MDRAAKGAKGGRVTAWVLILVLWADRSAVVHGFTSKESCDMAGETFLDAKFTDAYGKQHSSRDPTQNVHYVCLPIK